MKYLESRNFSRYDSSKNVSALWTDFAISWDSLPGLGASRGQLAPAVVNTKQHAMASACRDNSTAADVMTVQQEHHSILDASQHAMSMCTTMMQGQSTVLVSTRKKFSNPKVWMMMRSGFEIYSC
jgi:hypothetical protein